MPKNIEDMIVPDRRRSIRDIPIPEGRRKSDRLVHPEDAKRPAMPKKIREEVREMREMSAEEETLPPVRTTIPKRKRSPRKKVWASLALVAAAVVFGVLSMFNGATLSYVPKSANLTFSNDSYLAQKAGTGGLFYSVVKLSRDKGMSAPTGAEEQVSRKASGVIVVYNDSTEAQKLIENTRFESTAGKIYRIQTGVTVPAKRTANGTTQPGSIEVTIYADEAGEAYNSALTDFTVPGLKGTSRFNAIYARSKTPIAGGFIGKEKVVRAEDLASTKSQIQTALKEELYSEAEAEVPEEFILFRTLSTFSFEDLPQSTNASSGSATVNQRGNFYGIMFKRSDLASYLAQKKLGILSTETVTLSDFSGLDMSFAAVPPTDLLALNEIAVKITGNAQLVWTTDEVALKADLAGRHKSEVAGVLKNYPTIASASVTVRPFWKTSVPKEADKITVRKLKAE